MRKGTTRPKAAPPKKGNPETSRLESARRDLQRQVNANRAISRLSRELSKAAAAATDSQIALAAALAERHGYVTINRTAHEHLAKMAADAVDRDVQQQRLCTELQERLAEAVAKIEELETRPAALAR